MRAIVLALLMAATPAHAVDFAAPIMLLDGTTPLREQGDKGRILTLGEVAETALLSAFTDEPNLKGEEKVKRFVLAKKIEEQKKDPVLTADDIALIKTLIGKLYNPLVTGGAWKLLDPASVP